MTSEKIKKIRLLIGDLDSSSFTDAELEQFNPGDDLAELIALKIWKYRKAEAFKELYSKKETYSDSSEGNIQFEKISPKGYLSICDENIADLEAKLLKIDEPDVEDLPNMFSYS